MHWGIRRFQPYGKGGYEPKIKNRKPASSTRSKADDAKRAERNERLKTAAKVGAVVGIAAVGTVLAVKNRKAVESFLQTQLKNKDNIESYLKSQKQTASAIKKAADSAKNAKIKDYVKKNKDEILKSPRKTLKYKDHLSSEELRKAAVHFNSINQLHKARQSEIERGAKYVNAFLAYATVATTAYGVKNSPLVRDTKKKIDSDKRKRNRDDDHLEHHGIKGMHWGIRRFQSYEVTGGRKGGKTGKEVGAAKKQAGRVDNPIKAPRSSRTTSSKNQETKKGLSDETKAKLKKAAIVGAAVAGTALVAYGAHKYAKAVKYDKETEKIVSNAMRSMSSSYGKKLDSATKAHAADMANIKAEAKKTGFTRMATDKELSRANYANYVSRRTNSTKDIADRLSSRNGKVGALRKDRKLRSETVDLLRTENAAARKRVDTLRKATASVSRNDPNYRVKMEQLYKAERDQKRYADALSRVSKYKDRGSIADTARNAAYTARNTASNVAARVKRK